MKTYEEMIKLPTFEERYRYLRVKGGVANETFGSKRYLNQLLYQSDDEWKAARRKAIIRDNGCDLAMPDRVIKGKVKVKGKDREIKEPIYVHHIEPITIEDVLEKKKKVYDLNNLVCCSHRTHQAIHYGDETLLQGEPVERKPGDTCPWIKKEGLD